MTLEDIFPCSTCVVSAKVGIGFRGQMLRVLPLNFTCAAGGYLIFKQVQLLLASTQVNTARQQLQQGEYVHTHSGGVP